MSGTGDDTVGRPGEPVMESITFDEIEIGQAASLQRVMTAGDLELFYAATCDAGAMPSAGEAGEGGGATHSLWGGSLISAVLGTVLPGPGTRYLEQDFRFLRPVRVGETLIATVTVKAKRVPKGVVVFDCRCLDEDGKVVITGIAEVIAPVSKQRLPRIDLPKVQVIRHNAYEALINRARPLEPVPTAVVHPCDADSLRGVAEAVEANLIRPVLVGPSSKIRAAARQARVDIGAFELVPAEHSHGAAERAVALAHAGSVDAIVKGSLPYDEIMAAVDLPETSLHTARRLSYVTVVSVPTYPRLLFITDALLSQYPSLDEKVDICQNAIDFAQVLGVAEPKVAILSAVETVNSKIASTLDAAALCKMADRRQIKGAVLDGPLAFDNAISAEAAHTKGIVSPVAGAADILLVPDVESGNMVVKQLSYLANADLAGVVLGARVPIVLAGLVDTLRARLVSCAVAAILAHHRRDPSVKVVG